MPKKKTNRKRPPAAKSPAPRRPSTPSTPPPVEDVEGVEDWHKKPVYIWQMEAGLDRNFANVGRLLACLDRQIFRHPEGGLLFVESNKAVQVGTAKELAPLLIDNIRIVVTKNGKTHGEKPPDSVINNMLRSLSFLSNFQAIEGIVTTPVALSDFSPSQPGYNNGGILYLGTQVSPAKSIATITKFLNVMEWASNADRTNAVAALLTVPFRRNFPGGKPLVLVTANKSHAGKGTVIDFIQGSTCKAEILYENIDWPMQRSLQDQLTLAPEIGVINFDNVRIDSSGKGRLIRSGFLESFVTSAEIVLSSTRGKPVRMPNRFVVLLNTNEGSLSIDLLNRSLPIRLTPTGDLTERIARSPIGDPKHDFLPRYRDKIEAELWGMIERWRKEEKPLDTSVKHPMGPWAQTIGGILQVNGFVDFLANYSATRAAADPVREALSILAFYAGNKSRRAGDLAKVAVSEGLAKTLMPGVDSANTSACERQMGVTLRPYVGETFAAKTASEKITYRLKKESKRWDGASPHYRYTFEELSREAHNSSDGVILEERRNGGFMTDSGLDLDAYQPESV